VKPSRRTQQAVIAQWLRVEGGCGEGLTLAAIAREMGISISYASSLLADPTGEKERARKRKYLNRCQICNAPCHGDHCIKHSGKEVGKRQRKWNKQMVIEAIQEWELEHGRPPTSHEWAKRKGLPDWVPIANVVYRLFGKGGWNKAIEAAGFTPRPAGPPDWAKVEHGPAKLMGSDARERLSEERKALYAEDPDHPMFRGLKEGWDIGLVRRERRVRRYFANQHDRRKP
jgi:hypothetical protein